MKTLINKVAHYFAFAFNLLGNRRFKAKLCRLREVQEQKLYSLLEQTNHTKFGQEYKLSERTTYNDFANTVPLTNYSFWEGRILSQKNRKIAEISSECQRYQPTSGSTDTVKWIPYTRKLLNEFDLAASPWLYQIAKQDRRVLKGKHFWSLSWLPTHLRNSENQNANDDLALLPWWKRLFMGATMAVPQKTSLAPTSESALIASIVYLASHEDLSLISVWSPTFALSAISELSKNRKVVADILDKGSWLEYQQQLDYLPCPQNRVQAGKLRRWDGEITADFLKQLWPMMAFISSWDTSTSYSWAQKLKKLFPDATFQGKGLWATEGVVTIPYQGKYILSLDSHFYEFIDLTTGKVLPSWKLKEGMRVKPVLSTGSGLFRYVLEDQLLVDGFIGKTPTLTFLGRMGGVDMVGEKMATELAQKIMERIYKKCHYSPLSLIGVTNQQVGTLPQYIMLCEGEDNLEKEQELTNFVEGALLGSFHYKLARELNQLAPARAVTMNNAREIYQEMAANRGMILGNLKVEPLTTWDTMPHQIGEKLSGAVQ
jgi:hypothetical protein